MNFLENNLTVGSSKKMFFMAALGYIMCEVIKNVLKKGLLRSCK